MFVKRDAEAKAPAACCLLSLSCPRKMGRVEKPEEKKDGGPKMEATTEEPPNEATDQRSASFNIAREDMSPGRPTDWKRAISVGPARGLGEREMVEQAHANLMEMMARYVPLTAMESMLTGSSKRLQSQEGAVVAFIDIKSFSSATQGCSQVVGGLLCLHSALSELFASITDAVLASEGDVAHISGDALVAMWPVSMAVRAAKAMKHVVDTYETRKLPCEEGRLGLHGAMGFGSLNLQCEGSEGRWLYFLTGGSMQQIPFALAHARLREFVISKEASLVVVPHLNLVPLEEGGLYYVTTERQGGRSSSSTSSMDDSAKAPPSSPASNSGTHARIPSLSSVSSSLSPTNEGKTRPDEQTKRVCKKAEAKMNKYEQFRAVRRLVPTPLEYNPDGPTISTLAMLFVFIGELSTAFQVNDSLRGEVKAVQAIVCDHYGYVKEVCTDDKGLVLVAAFGLPPHPLSQHEAAKKALQAALKVSRPARGAGISVGEVAWGGSGSFSRTELSLIGTAVVTAARLAEKAWQQGRVLLDFAAAELVAASSIALEEIPFTHLKGLGQVRTFSPCSKGHHRSPSAAFAQSLSSRGR